MARIAFISNTSESIVNFRGPLIQELLARGHEVVALAPDHDDLTRKALEQFPARVADFKLSRTGMNPIEDVGTLTSLIRALRTARPDIVVARAVKPIVYGLPAARLAGVRRRFALLEGLGFVYTEPGEQGSVRKRLLRPLLDNMFRLSLSLADRVIFLNPDDLNEFESRALVGRSKSLLVRGIGVPLDEWPQVLPTTRPPCFVFVGRLLREKGVLDFVEAARRIRSARQDVRFVLLGSVDSNPTSLDEATVRQWVDSGLVEWPGFADPRPWFRQATAFVLPSYREGVPRSTQEAMASGLPVITTDVPGCRETVVDGRNGYLVPPRDPAALAGRMQLLIDCPERVVRFGQESRRLAEQWFDVRGINRQFLELLGL